MTIKQFIEKAIAGGWKKEAIDHFRTRMVRPNEAIIVVVAEKDSYIGSTFAGAEMPIERIFLDPLAWQAIGKVEGWQPEGDHCTSGDGCIEGQGAMHEGLCDWKHFKAEWLGNMHRMIDALAEGKTIEEFFETL